MPRPVIAVLHGPNLNLLASASLRSTAATPWPTSSGGAASGRTPSGSTSTPGRATHEGELVGWAQELRGCAGFVVNAGAYTHTSVALRDALVLATGPLVEVHLSNVHAREPFRHHSYLSDIATAVVVGAGVRGYDLAVDVVAAGAGSA